MKNEHNFLVVDSERKKIFTRIFILSLIIGLFTALILVVSIIINRYDPYAIAARQMLDILETHPGMEQRLGIYGQQASEWKIKIAPAVTLADGIIRTVDSMKNSQGWPVFLGLIDQLDGDRSLFEQIDVLARDILELDKALDKIVDSNSVGTNLFQLREKKGDVSQNDLEQIFSNSNRAIAGLWEVNAQLMKTSGKIREITPFLGQFKDWMDKNTTVIRVLPGVRELINGVLNGLDGWMELPDIMDDIHQQILEDVITLGKINYCYSSAKKIEDMLVQTHIRGISSWIVLYQKYFITLTVMNILLAIGCQFGLRYKKSL